MKDQYFGDINDYRKYGLLRCVIEASNLRVLVAWMLTPDDGGPHGGNTAYLDQPARYEQHDSTLFNTLRDLMINGERREVAMIEETDLLSATRYFSDPLHDALLKRDERFRSLTTKAELSDLVFLDPDKGLQVKSISYGAANSSQYLFLHEAQKLWELGKSLLIYQHFPREKRAGYIRKRVKELQCRITNSHVSAFLTAHVVFLMVLQPKHKSYYKSIVEKIEERWNGQIDHRSPILPRFCRHVRDLVSAARRIIARFSRLVSALISASRR